MDRKNIISIQILILNDLLNQGVIDRAIYDAAIKRLETPRKKVVA